MASIPSCTTVASHSCLTSKSFTSSSSSVKLSAQFLGTRNMPGRVRPLGLGPSKCWFRFVKSGRDVGIYASQSDGELGKDNVEQEVEKQVMKAGTGPKPVAGQNVTVHCTGYGKDADIRKKRLIEKYKNLKGSGTLDTFLEQRRMKNASKDHRYIPYRRPDNIE